MMISLGAFGVAYAIMPFAMGEVADLDYRFPSAVAFIALASFRAIFDQFA